MMPQRQYEFVPQETDPRIAAERHWEDMRNELNVTRDALEDSQAAEKTLSALVDMLRQEIADTKFAYSAAQTSLTTMQTKLKAAGMLILDALKDSGEPEPPKRLRLQDLPPSPPRQPPIQPRSPPIEPADDDEGVADIISRLPPRLPTNRF